MSVNNTHLGFEEIRARLAKCKSVFFVGAGGINMSSLAIITNLELSNSVLQVESVIKRSPYSISTSGITRRERFLIWSANSLNLASSVRSI